jgi:hypothetical protein
LKQLKFCQNRYSPNLREKLRLFFDFGIHLMSKIPAKPSLTNLPAADITLFIIPDTTIQQPPELLTNSIINRGG